MGDDVGRRTDLHGISLLKNRGSSGTHPTLTRLRMVAAGQPFALRRKNDLPYPACSTKLACVNGQSTPSQSDCHDSGLGLVFRA